jgi:hypothetical protein
LYRVQNIPLLMLVSVFSLLHGVDTLYFILYRGGKCIESYTNVCIIGSRLFLC